MFIFALRIQLDFESAVIHVLPCDCVPKTETFTESHEPSIPYILTAISEIKDSDVTRDIPMHVQASVRKFL